MPACDADGAWRCLGLLRLLGNLGSRCPNGEGHTWWKLPREDSRAPTSARDHPLGSRGLQALGSQILPQLRASVFPSLEWAQ